MASNALSQYHGLQGSFPTFLNLLSCLLNVPSSFQIQGLTHINLVARNAYVLEHSLLSSFLTSFSHY